MRTKAGVTRHPAYLLQAVRNRQSGYTCTHLSVFPPNIVHIPVEVIPAPMMSTRVALGSETLAAIMSGFGFSQVMRERISRVGKI